MPILVRQGGKEEWGRGREEEEEVEEEEGKRKGRGEAQKRGMREEIVGLLKKH